METEEISMTGDKILESLGSRYFLRVVEEATRGQLVATDISVGCLGGRWALAASGLAASPEASCLKSWQKLMALISLSMVLCRRETSTLSSFGFFLLPL